MRGIRNNSMTKLKSNLQSAFNFSNTRWHWLQDIERRTASISKDLLECEVAAFKDELKRGMMEITNLQHEVGYKLTKNSNQLLAQEVSRGLSKSGRWSYCWCAVGKIRADKDASDNTWSWKKIKEEQYPSAQLICRELHDKISGKKKKTKTWITHEHYVQLSQHSADFC